jgi:hypothetical protein
MLNEAQLCLPLTVQGIPTKGLIEIKANFGANWLTPDRNFSRKRACKNRLTRANLPGMKDGPENRP